MNATSSLIHLPLVEATRYICQMWLSFPISIFGIFGNCFSILVFNRYKQSKPTTLLLKSIAVTGTFILILNILLGPLREFNFNIYNHVISHTFRILFTCLHICRLTHTWLTVLLTVERYIAVTQPFKAQIICSYKHTKFCIGFIIVFMVFFSIPRFFEYKRVTFEEAPTGFAESQMMKNQVYMIVYRIFLSLFITYIIPIILLIFLNIKITTVLRWANKQHTSFFLFKNHKTEIKLNTNTERPRTEKVNTQNYRRHKSNSFNEMTQSLTIIAVIVVTVFIVCNLAVLCSQVIYSIEVSIKETKDHLELSRRIMANVSNVLSTISSSVNFIIYCQFSTRFRLILLDIICCKKRASCKVLLKKVSTENKRKFPHFKHSFNAASKKSLTERNMG